MAEVLVIDGGGRGAAIEQAMWASDEVTRVLHVGAEDKQIQAGLENFAGQRSKPLVVIGPEAPLVAGLADDLREDGYPVLGASADAAQYEASKARATRMAQMFGVNVPETQIVDGEFLEMAEAAAYYINRHEPTDYVVKADGLCGGKGVVVPDSSDEATEAVNAMLLGQAPFGKAGKEAILLQNRHYGPEVSAMVLVGRGKDDFDIMPLSQDHKRLLNDDQGPNTGGMGAYAPVPETIVNGLQYEKIREMAYLSLAGMEAEGVTYQKAVLYIGMMMATNVEASKVGDPMLIEYNVRFGDPEIQTILPLLTRAGVDSYRLMRSAAEGSLEVPPTGLNKVGGAAVSICGAAPGYPLSPEKGAVIHGLDQHYAGVTIQEAGVKTVDGQKTVNGGRVFFVTGTDWDINEAADNAYAAIGENGVHFDGMQYRTDIGWQARTA